MMYDYEEKNKKITQEDLNELMKGLGFHRIPSKGWWKMKISDTILLKDTDLQRYIADPKGYCSFLERSLDKQIRAKQSLIRKKRMLLAFFAA